MRCALINSFSLRLVLTILLSGLMLVIGFFGEGGQAPTWAAPAQNPLLQTVPTRFPDDPPPESNPPPEEPAPAPDEEKEDDEPAQPSKPADPVSQENPQPAAPEQTDSGGQNEVQPTPTPKPASSENKDQAPPVQPASGEDKKDSGFAASPQADLSLSKMVSNPTPYLGEVITFTIAISNNGPHSATNVLVSDPLPPGLVLNTAVPGRGEYSHNLGLWAVAIITPGQRITLSLVVTVTNAGIVTNTAEITAAHPADPDSIPGNSLEYEDDWASVSLNASPAAARSFQSDSDSLTLTQAARPVSGSFVQWLGSLSWLFVLALGLILILSGMYLVNRA